LIICWNTFKNNEKGTPLSIDYARLPPRLRREARQVLIAAAAAHAATFLLIGGWGSFARAAAWLAPASAAAAWICLRFRRLLPLNRPGGHDAVFPDLGAANRITLVRGILVAHLAGFALLPWPRMKVGPLPWAWIPGMLYGAAVILDGLDGTIARRTARVTRMGRQLDMETDALGLLAAAMVAVAAGKLPPVYLAAGLAYYLFSAGIRIRASLGKPAAEVHPWQGARIIAGFQMALATAALLPPVRPPAATLAAWVVMVPLLAGFVRDWLIVCGRASNDCFSDARWGRWIHRWATRWMPIGARVSALGCAAAWLAPRPVRLEGFVLAAAAALLAAGWMGRTAAAVVVWISGGLLGSDDGGTWEISVLFAAALVVLMAGSGPGSWWRPEDRFFCRGAAGRAS
jgi:CDP-diacylglycerol--glycerol-3-phosphate 3-phosphatidyltransferase